MRWLEWVRRQKLLSLTLVLVTLGIGIVIGTLLNTGVHAARGQAPAPDASPLVVPSPVQLGNEFSKLAQRLEPSVVYITADYTPKASDNPHRGGQEEGDKGDSDEGSDLFRRFFKNGPFGGGDTPPRAFRQEQSGTGFIVDKNGYIITNNHVVSKVDHIKVKLHTDDTTEYRARVIGVDPETDLAVLKIDPKVSLVPVTIGNSDAVQVGDWAVAIGSPFGLDASVTAGIVSALGRDIGGQLQRFIQTDAAINPGNSGGPLLNIRGEVIGVNTMIATQSGGYQGIGFALPINMVARVYNDIIRSGRVTRGSIGIEFTKADEKPELFKALGTNSGVLISRVQKDGPADKAGLKAEDIITALNGKPVKDGEDLVGRVSDTPVGTAVNLTVDRDGKRMDFKVTILDRAEVFKDRPEYAELRHDSTEETPKPAEAQYKFGIKLHALTDAERKAMNLESNGGLVVRSVDPGSFAEDVGLFEKDVILSINRQPVATVDDVVKIQSSLKPGDAIAFRVMRPVPGGRGGAQQWTTFFVSGTLPPQ